MLDPKNDLTIANVRTNLAFAANANVTGVDLKDYVGNVAIVFNIGASTAGTNPTYDAALQSGAASDGSDAAAFSPAVAITQATAASHQVLSVDTRKAGRYLKIVQTIGGTSSPSFPVSISIVGRKQVQ
jgi:hypothetical protein